MGHDSEHRPTAASNSALDLYLEQTLRDTLALIAGAPDDHDLNVELAAILAALRARRRSRIEIAAATAVSLAAVAVAATTMVEPSPRSSRARAAAGAAPPAMSIALAPTTTAASLSTTTLATLPPATLPPTTLATLPPTTVATLVEAVGPMPMPMVNGADAPDPFALVADGQTWVFATNAGGRNVPAATWSPDGEVVVHDALPVLPGWADRGWTWAPAVAPTAGGWTMWFTARHRASGRQCVGAGRATSIGGPYIPAAEPLLCELNRGGVIDASPVVDDGHVVLVFKVDGNCCGLPTTIEAIELDPTGMAFIGRPVELLRADQPWEAGLIEAPSMRRSDNGDWLLLYSANFWDSADYAVGVARCDTPMGPCRKQAMAALDDDAFPGAGGAEFVPGSDLVVLHEWAPEGVGYETGSRRRMRVANVDEIGTQVVLRVLAA